MNHQTVAATVRAGLLGGAVVATALLTTGTDGPPSDARDASPRGVVAAELRTAMSRHECTTHGFGEGVVPASAVVRRPSGRLQAVTFARGWVVFEGGSPGDLVAVCLDDVHALRGSVARADLLRRATDPRLTVGVNAVYGEHRSQT